MRSRTNGRTGSEWQPVSDGMFAANLVAGVPLSWRRAAVRLVVSSLVIGMLRENDEGS